MNTGIKYQVGESLGDFYYVRWVGVDPEDGQQIWLDDKGNETKEYSDNYAVFTGKNQYHPGLEVSIHAFHGKDSV